MEKNSVNLSKNRWKTAGLFVLFFLTFLLILHSLPLSLDDYGFLNEHFASTSQALHYVLTFGNGRFLGNSGIIFLMHHLVLGDVIRAAVLAGIAVLLPVVLSLNSLPTRLLSMFLLLTIAPGIFGQVYSWMSGFQNYVPPLLLLLLTLLLIRESGRGSLLAKIRQGLLVFLLAVCMQFYIEHSSCMNVLTAFLLTIWLKRKKDPRFSCAFLFLLGALLGLVCMFFAMFFVAPEVHGGVQSYFSGGFFNILRGLLRNAVLLFGMYTENAIALCTMAIICSVLLARFPNAVPERKRRFVYFGMLGPSAIFLLSLISSVKPFYGKLAVAESLLLILAMLVYMISVLYTLLSLSRNTGRQNIIRAAVLYVLALVAVLPILVVWPTGYRCLFHSCVMLFGAELSLAEDLIEYADPPKVKKMILEAMAVALAAAILCQTAVFTDIRRMVSIRDAWLEEQAEMGADSAAYFLLPTQYIYDIWNGENVHYATVGDRQIQLEILPADVWFRMYYYHYT